MDAALILIQAKHYTQADGLFRELYPLAADPRINRIWRTQDGYWQVVIEATCSNFDEVSDLWERIKTHPLTDVVRFIALSSGDELLPRATPAEVASKKPSGAQKAVRLSCDSCGFQETREYDNTFITEAQAIEALGKKHDRRSLCLGNPYIEHI